MALLATGPPTQFVLLHCHRKNPGLSKANGCQIGFFIVHCAPKMMSMDPKLPPPSTQNYSCPRNPLFLPFLKDAGRQARKKKARTSITVQKIIRKEKSAFRLLFLYGEPIVVLTLKNLFSSGKINLHQKRKLF